MRGGTIEGMRNWAGNYEYRARRLLEPRTPDELRDAVVRSDRFRILGSRHSFNDLADSDGDLITLAGLPRIAEVDAASSSVTIDGAIRYGDLAPLLDVAGFGLHNLGSLPHISVAGAVATATHGSGAGNRNLSAAVRAVEVLRTDGSTDRYARGDDATFPGVVVSLGAMGVVTRLTLDLEPRYDVAQAVYDDLPVDAFRANVHDLLADGYSVSAFTLWRGRVVDQVWVKRRVGAGASWGPVLAEQLGATPAREPRHPVPGLDPDACTLQLAVPGSWHERLAHFRLEHTPSAGAELQSEYFVPAGEALAAFDAVDALRERIAPLLFTSEIRTIAEDDLWLSPAFGRESVAIHFTWRPLWEQVLGVLPAIEEALAPFEPRPHWGKVFTMTPDAVAAAYPRLADARALASRLDPAGKLRNRYLDRYLFGGPASAG